jgi:hypothetical protein
VLDEILLKNAQRIRADERMCFAMSVPYFISNKHLNNAQMKEKFFRTSEFIKSGAALSCMFMRLNNV